MLSLLAKHKWVIFYGAGLALVLFVLRWLELRFLLLSLSLEVYVAAIAVIFTGLGIWLALKLVKPETIIVEKEIVLREEKSFTLNESALETLGLSKREHEVLALMAEGLSNAEIAARLFVSLNTIKSHSSKIFEKLEVKRRTQAVEKAKRLNILA